MSIAPQIFELQAQSCCCATAGCVPAGRSTMLLCSCLFSNHTWMQLKGHGRTTAAMHLHAIQDKGIGRKVLVREVALCVL